jgi:serine/threonine protein kinase
MATGLMGFMIGRPLFPGISNPDQLLKIFQLLGTPTELTWPGIKDLPEYKPNYPIYPPQDFLSIAPKLQSDGVDLVLRMLVYNPDRRTSAVEALTRISKFKI